MFDVVKVVLSTTLGYTVYKINSRFLSVSFFSKAAVTVANPLKKYLPRLLLYVYNPQN